MTAQPFVLALSGGIGGAKLSLGLQGVLPPHRLAVAVNTGDDFEHLGLFISPDVDTTLYTLSGLADSDKGWGRGGETWSFMTEIERFGGEGWFRLGDKDLALHVERTRRLAAGESLVSISEDFARRVGLATRILPATNDKVRTLVQTDAGLLGFQDYFVRRRCVPRVLSISYEGASAADPAAEILEILARPDLGAIVICPSNPYLSIDPILSIQGFRDALRAADAPVVAVSPLIGGAAVKGPTAKIMTEMGLATSSLTVARHYGDLVDGWVLDRADTTLAEQFTTPTLITATLMQSPEHKLRLAGEVLEFAKSI
jgi:LPPG:FO 2-phospho-L-lactate transferase